MHLFWDSIIDMAYDGETVATPARFMTTLSFDIMNMNEMNVRTPLPAAFP